MDKDTRCPCGSIILADTEEWDTPLCYGCYRFNGLERQCEKLCAENSALKEALARYQEALEHIFTKSKDNWAAARAERGLGRGKVVATPEHIGKQDKN